GRGVPADGRAVDRGAGGAPGRRPGVRPGPPARHDRGREPGRHQHEATEQPDRPGRGHATNSRGSPAAGVRPSPAILPDRVNHHPTTPASTTGVPARETTTTP